MKKFIRYHFPQPLPQNKEEMAALIDEVSSGYNIPLLDNVKSAICGVIMHHTKHKAPLKIFVQAAKKQLANEQAYAIIESIRAKAKQEAASAVVSKAQG